MLFMFLFVITMNTVVVLCQRRNNEYFEVRCRGVFSVFWCSMSGDPRGGRAGLPGARLGPGHGLQLRQPRERGVLRRHADSLPGTSWAMKYLIFYHTQLIDSTRPRCFMFASTAGPATSGWSSTALSAPTGQCSSRSTSPATGGTMWTAGPPRTTMTSTTICSRSSSRMLQRFR